MPAVRTNLRPSSRGGLRFPFHAEEDVSLFAPMVGQVAGRVLDHAHPDAVRFGAEVACAPGRHAGLALVLGGFNARPVGGAEGGGGPSSWSGFLAECGSRWTPMLAVRRRMARRACARQGASHCPRGTPCRPSSQCRPYATTPAVARRFGVHPRFLRKTMQNLHVAMQHRHNNRPLLLYYPRFLSDRDGVGNMAARQLDGGFPVRRG